MPDTALIFLQQAVLERTPIGRHIEKPILQRLKELSANPPSESVVFMSCLNCGLVADDRVFVEGCRNCGCKDTTSISHPSVQKDV